MWRVKVNFIFIILNFIKTLKEIFNTSLRTQNCPESEFNEFKQRLKSAQNRSQLSAGINLETLNSISNGTNHIWTASQRNWVFVTNYDFLISISLTQCRRLLIFQTMNSVRWKNLSLIYQRFTPSGRKNIGIRKSEFVTKPWLKFFKFGLKVLKVIPARCLSSLGHKLRF